MDNFVSGYECKLLLYGHWTPENTIAYQTFFLNKKLCPVTIYIDFSGSRLQYIMAM